MPHNNFAHSRRCTDVDFYKLSRHQSCLVYLSRNKIQRCICDKTPKWATHGLPQVFGYCNSAKHTCKNKHIQHRDNRQSPRSFFNTCFTTFMTTKATNQLHLAISRCSYFISHCIRKIDHLFDSLLFSTRPPLEGNFLTRTFDINKTYTDMKKHEQET